MIKLIFLLLLSKNLSCSKIYCPLTGDFLILFSCYKGDFIENWKIPKSIKKKHKITY